jgi:glycosyltransferase involved in cell wall biosynthesis
MKITILSHDLSSNSALRAHRLALAARHFADVKLIGPVHKSGLWPALPAEKWIQGLPASFSVESAASFLDQVEADGEVLLAVKPHLASFGVALIATQRNPRPLILDLDDLDTAFLPGTPWMANPSLADFSQPASPVFVHLLTRSTAAAHAITVSSTALQKRFGGTLIHQGCATDIFIPAGIDRAAARREFGFTGPTVLFVGTPRPHKGLMPLAQAVSLIPGVRLAVSTTPEANLSGEQWSHFPIQRIPMVPYTDVARLIAASDLVAIPQMDTEAARYQMPLKVYDCMAMGVPIVASSVSDLPQVLKGCAHLVPPGDIQALAAAIQKVLDDPGTARLMGLRARKKCLANYTMAHVAQALREVVHRVAPPRFQREVSASDAPTKRYEASHAN